MNIPPLATYEANTNRKLLYANILLDLAEEQSGHHLDALLLSCVINTLSAYYALLEESQRRLNLPPQAGLNALGLLEAMRTNAVYAVEIEQLAKLEQEQSSWFSGLQQAYKQLTRSPSMQGLEMIGGGGADAAEITYEQCSAWFAELQQLCSRLRASLSES